MQLQNTTFKQVELDIQQDLTALAEWSERFNLFAQQQACSWLLQMALFALCLLCVAVASFTFWLRFGPGLLGHAVLGQPFSEG